MLSILIDCSNLFKCGQDSVKVIERKICDNCVCGGGNWTSDVPGDVCSVPLCLTMCNTGIHSLSEHLVPV